jgi:hypothetical protein
VKIEEYLWTFNMPTDHPRVSFTDVWVPEDAMFGPLGAACALAQSLRAREPHPPGGQLAGRGRLLRQRERALCA